ncbi:NAD-dependent epimerase/dehydratase family protein [Acinetobacter gerneri]|uniref:UDP-glucose 4-epimerase n=1 Tax=Acinetobacter gerneri DSM 14967 = CIP 107464 = MTCC 9824 TaxID=1120926 RepID=N8ZMX2_9GAMM|nr:NAD-dependent epimerase/dehydratase family protein [Acinetobacter gerneri]ENV33098.1 UDP-glucose 4-epimerase [Acinetobacter gerneri DSM 14967 = CIP 107464 = MTCC 9824]EPR82708.1 UDP-glucose 4-epimerase [Acinetobacter gerneri DSM 14967 = CIP 107464 = MTCC 9824]MDV2441787.1 NAD-dependent epimerase/dehydratase family protein [Acinetobacter gerneri]
MILVTGGLGFIGSHVVLSLLAQGQEVVIVDNLANASLQTLERLEYISGMYIPFVKIDIRNTPALNKVFEQYSIQAVIHTAGFKSLEESVLKPLEYYNDNVSCMMSLLRAMQRTGVRTLVHLSSLTVYGISSLELDEETPYKFAYPNPYIKSQQMVEEILRDTCSTDSEWRVAILRLSNVVGAFEHGVLGEVVNQLPKNIVPLALQVAAMQRDAIELQSSADTADGTVERSFVHVLDSCEAIQKALIWLQDKYGVCEAFNIAGEVHSIKALLQEIENVTQTEIKVFDAQEQRKELDQVGSSSQKALDVLQWQAKRPLKQMIEDEWRFYQNTLNNR